MVTSSIIVSVHRGLSQDVILVHAPPSALREECSSFVVDELSGSFLTESEPVKDLWESTKVAGAPRVMGCIRDCRRRFRITEIPSRDCWKRGSGLVPLPRKGFESAPYGRGP